jgi:hypothetical protein
MVLRASLANNSLAGMAHCGKKFRRGKVGIGDFKPLAQFFVPIHKFLSPH